MIKDIEIEVIIMIAASVVGFVLGTLSAYFFS